MSIIDEKKLAKAYNHALKLEKAGKREEAAAAWRRATRVANRLAGHI